MAEYWNVFRERSAEYWNSWSPNQKALFAGGILFLILALGMTVWALTRPDQMEALYTKLEPNDAAAITEKLTEMKTPYELADNGTTILVAPNAKYQARLDMAALGLPKGNAGFESLSETSFGDTTRDKEIRFALALQGELAKTIGALQGIEQSWVYLTMPEKPLFAKDETARTASVVLQLKQGTEMQPDQVRGIVHLVAKGVEGLDPKNVTVIDINGRILSEDILEFDSQFSPKLTATQLEMQDKFEVDAAQKIQSMLERVVGYGNAVVRVRADLDFDQREVVSEIWGERVPRSTETTEERTQGQNITPQGVAGTDSNIPEYPAITEQNQNFLQEKETSVQNNEIDRTETHLVAAPGAVKRLSVAVVINADQLPQDRLNAIDQAARMAAGIQEDRGDQITVNAVPFDTTYWDQIREQMEADARNEAIKKGSIIVGVLLVLILIGVIVFLILRRKREEETIIDTQIDEPIPVEDLLDLEEEEEEEDLISPEEQERIQRRDQIQRLAQENPEELAQLLNVWLSEDER